MAAYRIGAHFLITEPPTLGMVGIATALALEPQLPHHWRVGRADVPTLRPIDWKNKPLAASAHLAAVKFQLSRLSRQRATVPDVSPAWALLASQVDTHCRARRYRRWIGARSAAS